ncbi:MAG: DUF2085 domain-containing protein [Firmicutes bacterium]|nr:DUF2085 domain-containing protein [Bacillota bacterium]
MNYPTSARFDKQIRFIYKWLPIFCGCHQRPERSFFVRGYQMPVCARCEGELIGILAALIAVWFVRPAWWLMAAIMAPMIIDGLIQALTSYESNNWRRLITGLLFGFGIAMLFFIATIELFKFGLSIGINLRS